jgi:hypothetical protein
VQARGGCSRFAEGGADPHVAHGACRGGKMGAAGA